MDAHLVHSVFLIFSGAAVLASVALFTRQPVILAYIALGILIGPHGTRWITDATLLGQIAEIGIIFLLFLLGLDMQPKALLHVLKQASGVAIGSSLAFWAAGFGIGVAFGWPVTESVLVGLAVIFSSTIIGIKLLPTTVLHHRHTGELVVGLLLLQDLIAIVTLIFVAGSGNGDILVTLARTLVGLPLLAAAALLGVRFAILPLLRRFDKYHEYLFLLTIGWCLAMAFLAEYVGLSLEIGAFMGGVSMATTPVTRYIAESLKPLRDFFLVMFFFTLGAGFNPALLAEVWLPVAALTLVLLLIKPLVFARLLVWTGERPTDAKEVGMRLGQISEFSLLLVFLAQSKQLMGDTAAMLVQATAIAMFAINTYMVILRYPSPIAISDALRRD
ncbi:cation:proton antiporter [Hahella sp. SMD15-11]|uniref:Cation:proton antiporter n=1 Tax=Thermohahella caldifontis TaxID=3142973 RepID=A0AB39UY85_9GAMM